MSAISDMVKESHLEPPDVRGAGPLWFSVIPRNSKNVYGMSSSKEGNHSCRFHSASLCPGLCQLWYISHYRNHPQFHTLKLLYKFALHPHSETLTGVWNNLITLKNSSWLSDLKEKFSIGLRGFPFLSKMKCSISQALGHTPKGEPASF